MPSSVWVGGIRMSVSTASGECSATDAHSESGSVDGGHQLDALDLGQQRGDSFPDQVVVVGEDDAKGHARDCSTGRVAGTAERRAASPIVVLPAPSWSERRDS